MNQPILVSDKCEALLNWEYYNNCFARKSKTFENLLTSNLITKFQLIFPKIYIYFSYK